MNAGLINPRFHAEGGPDDMIHPRFYAGLPEIPPGVLVFFADQDRHFIRAVRRAVEILRPRDPSNILSRWVNVRLDLDAYVYVVAIGCYVVVRISETQRSPALEFSFENVSRLDDAFPVPELLDSAGRYPHAEAAIQAFSDRVLRKAFRDLMARCLLRMLPQLLRRVEDVH